MIPAKLTGVIVFTAFLTLAAMPVNAATPAGPVDPASTTVDPASTTTDPAGTDPAGTDPAGTDPAGTDPAGTDPAGTDPADPVDPLALTVDAIASIPAGKEGVAYPPTTLVSSVSGGIAPYLTTITGVPSGMTASTEDFVLSGTPALNAEGVYTITIFIAENPLNPGVNIFAWVTATLTYELEILDAPKIATSELAHGQVDVAYTGSVSTTEGTAPFTYTMTGAPSGLTINSSTGVISGTPAAGTAGTWELTFKVVDSNNLKHTKTLSLEILEITTTELPDAQVGQDYSVTFAGNGGTKPYTWSATGLPAGLTLDSSGIVSGKPSANIDEAAEVIVTMEDASAREAEVTLTLIVNPKDLKISTLDILPATGGIAYSLQLTLQGGYGPYTWSANGLPEGLAIDATTGKIEGVTSAEFAGNYPIEVSVTDSFWVEPDTSIMKYSLVVYEEEVIPFVINETSLAAATSGEDYAAVVTVSGGSAPYAWSVTGLPEGVDATSDGLALILEGSPEVNAGVYYPVAVVTDADGSIASRNFMLTVLPIEESEETAGIVAPVSQALVGGVPAGCSLGAPVQDGSWLVA
ncbi:MAG: putative Ig domain-containing protein, partial [Planctomycetaceae bacterium]|nr:putative Ig domain-containing protein [Planctomycetaceae bacterium]